MPWAEKGFFGMAGMGSTTPSRLTRWKYLWLERVSRLLKTNLCFSSHPLIRSSNHDFLQGPWSFDCFFLMSFEKTWDNKSRECGGAIAIICCHLESDSSSPTLWHLQSGSNLQPQRRFVGRGYQYHHQMAHFFDFPPGPVPNHGSIRTSGGWRISCCKLCPFAFCKGKGSKKWKSENTNIAREFQK